MNRFERVKKFMQQKNINQIIITDPFDIFYLTGQLIDPGERFFGMYLNCDGTKKILVNELFKLKNIDDVEIFYYADFDDPIKILADMLKNKSVLVDKNFPARFLLPLMNFCDVKYFVSDVLEYVRLIKDTDEINLMRRSSYLSDHAMNLLVANIYEGQSELELVEILKDIKKKLEFDAFSFEPIIAFGGNAAEPHHIPNETKLKLGDCIVIDIGFVKDNYCSDMTRTFFYRYVTDFDKKIYDIVLQANLMAIDKIKPGVRFCDIDLAARNFIKDNGYEKNFIHTTGHSIGLQCHEFGTVSFRNHDTIKPGMIFSIEPGIYLKNKIGVRIEDLILVTDNGCELLNNYPKKLRII